MAWAQGVHPGGGGQAPRHTRHHIRVDDGNIGNVVDIHADKFPPFFDVGDDVIDGDLRGGSGGGGNRDGKHRFVFGGSYPLEGTDVGECGIVDNDAHRLAGIHARAAADRDHIISARRLISCHAGLYVFDGGVGLHIGKNRIGHAVCIQEIGHLFRHAEFQQIGIRYDQGFPKPFGLDNAGNFADSASPMVGYAVEHNAICHTDHPFLNFSEIRCFQYIQCIRTFQGSADGKTAFFPLIQHAFALINIQSAADKRLRHAETLSQLPRLRYTGVGGFPQLVRRKQTVRRPLVGFVLMLLDQIQRAAHRMGRPVAQWPNS